MAEFNDMKAIATISKIAEESEVKVIFSSSCSKAQQFLSNKLRTESKHQNEIYDFLNDTNLKLKAEIQIAERQSKSCLLALEIIKSANIELNKDLLIAKEKNKELGDRIRTNEDKYESLWQECKKKYESLPFVQQLLQQKNIAQTLYNELVNCKIQIETLQNDIKIKKATTFKLDKSRIIDLAKYVSHEMKNKINTIQEKSVIILKLTQEIDMIIKENSVLNKSALESTINKNNTKLDHDIKKGHESYINIEKTMQNNRYMMPNLQLTNFDLDINLEQLKIKKNVTFNVTHTKTKIPFGSDSGITSNLHFSKDDQPFEKDYMSLYYKIPNATNNECRKRKKYSERKLINILDDVKLDKNETQEIISRIDSDKFETVNMIVADSAAFKLQLSTPPKQSKLSQEHKEMEIIEIPTSNTENILMPPSQFLDMTQDKTFGIVDEQDTHSTLHNEDLPRVNVNKKVVSFNITASQNCINKETNRLEEETDMEIDETANNQLNNSVVSEEDFVKIKNKILKDRQLDLSPQFVYAKNNRAENKIVTSKFFQNDNNKRTVDIESTTKNKAERVIDIEEIEEKIDAKENEQGTQIQSSEEKVVKAESHMLKQTVRGLLFNHESQCIPDSLNISVVDDGDPDYPQFIDSNVLLSPKAELPIQSNNNTQVQSEEVPNFFSGLRKKTGLFFFGERSAVPSSDQKIENTQNQNNIFSFNFGSEEQKNKGFFNMFN